MNSKLSVQLRESLPRDLLISAGKGTNVLPDFIVFVGHTDLNFLDLGKRFVWLIARQHVSAAL